MCGLGLREGGMAVGGGQANAHVLAAGFDWFKFKPKFEA